MSRVTSLLLFLFLSLGYGSVASGVTSSMFGGEVNPAVTSLKINSTAASAGMWLGITMYPPKVREPAREGVSRILPMRAGYNTITISIPQGFRNGTYEVAVWRRRLSGTEIAPNDTESRKNGYKLTGMVSYLWGYLAAP